MKSTKLGVGIAAIFAVLIALGAYGFWRDQQAKGLQYDLLAAAGQGDTKSLARLLVEGAPMNARFGGNGATALHRAVEQGRVEAVRFLIEHGADVNMGDSEGATPLIAASYRGHAEIAQMLLDAGANVNVQDQRDGYTPLQEAARKGHGDVVRLLLARGADVNLKTRDGRTALARARAAGFGAVIQELQLAGAAD